MDKKTLKTEHIEKRRLIINKLVNSGINITPATLQFILTLDNPVEKVNSIIKEASFNPTFNGHLTLNILNKSSNESILKALKRKTIRQDKSLSKMEIRVLNVINSVAKSKGNIINLDTIINLVHEENKDLIIKALESLITQKVIIPFN